MRRPRMGWCGWLFAGAAALRILYVSAAPEAPPQDTPDYDEIARNLLAGQGFVSHENWFGHPVRSWRAPGYPLMLAAVYGVAGFDHQAVRLVQAVLGALTVILVYLLALRLRPSAAPLAGVAAALYPPLLASANEVMSECLFTGLLVAALWAAVESRHRPGRRWAFVTGVLIALAGLTRPVGLLAAPAVLAVAAWEDRAALQAWLRRWALPLGAGLVVTLAPWTARNGLVHGAFVPVSTHGGFIVARSNADQPDWRRPDGWRIDGGHFEAVPREVERDRRWWRQGLGWIAANPLAWLRLAGERLLRFGYFFQPGYNAAFVLAAPFWVWGLVRRGRTPGFRYPAAAIVLSAAVFCFVLYGSTRFRLPLEPLLLVFGAAAAHEGWRRGGRLFAGGCAAWAALQGLVWWQAEAARAAVISVLEAGGLR